MGSTDVSDLQFTTEGHDHKTPIHTSFDHRLDRFSPIRAPTRKPDVSGPHDCTLWCSEPRLSVMTSCRCRLQPCRLYTSTSLRD